MEDTNVTLARMEERLIKLQETMDSQQHEPRINSLEHSRTKIKAVVGTAWGGIVGLGWLWWKTFG